ncbi:MFS transporter, partial [Gordonia phosphorivorans]
RAVFIGSFPAIAAATAAFGLLDGTAARFCCMLIAGAGAGAAQTTASVFIVEGRPRSEWGERMGWLRLAFGVGQVAGLAVAAYFAHRLEAGWIVVGVVMAFGTLLAALRLPRIAKAPPTADPTGSARHSLSQALFSQFGVFLLCWLFAMIGLMTFYNVVPLILRAAFDVDPSTTSLVFMAGSAIGAVLYPVCGDLDRRIGSARLLAIGIGVTLIGFLILASATLAHSTTGAVFGCLALVLIATVYPFQYVGATLLAAEIAPGGEGSAMGLFNSGVAAGAVIGAIVPMFLAKVAGYDSLPLFSLGAMIISVAFGLPLLRHLRRSSPQSFALP